jgi:hypothetical protein
MDINRRNPGVVYPAGYHLPHVRTVIQTIL